jgi:hypothetical protein
MRARWYPAFGTRRVMEMMLMQPPAPVLVLGIGVATTIGLQQVSCRKGLKSQWMRATQPQT